MLCLYIVKRLDANLSIPIFWFPGCQWMPSGIRTFGYVCPFRQIQTYNLHSVCDTTSACPRSGVPRRRALRVEIRKSQKSTRRKTTYSRKASGRHLKGLACGTRDHPREFRCMWGIQLCGVPVLPWFVKAEVLSSYCLLMSFEIFRIVTFERHGATLIIAKLANVGQKWVLICLDGRFGAQSGLDASMLSGQTPVCALGGGPRREASRRKEKNRQGAQMCAVNTTLAQRRAYNLMKDNDLQLKTISSNVAAPVLASNFGRVDSKRISSRHLFCLPALDRRKVL